MPYRDSGQARQYQREYRRLRRAGDGRTTPVHPDIPPPVRLRRAADYAGRLEGLELAALNYVARQLDLAALYWQSSALLRQVEAADPADRPEGALDGLRGGVRLAGYLIRTHAAAWRRVCRRLRL